MVASASPRPALSLAGDLAIAFDPVLFAASVGFTLDSWQADVARCPSSRVLLNCSRQVGKTTVVSLLALHEALFQPSSMILLLAPSERQSGELFRAVARAYIATGGTVPSTAETKLKLELANGSRIIACPASEATIRGYGGVTTLVLDEAARVQDDLYEAVVPMLATTQGRIYGLSTPKGRRGWWASAWLSGSDTWARFEVPAWKSPRITSEWLDEQRETMGSFYFSQEFECQFLEGETSVFTQGDVDRAFSEEFDEWDI